MRVTSSLTIGADSAQNRSICRFIAEQGHYRSGSAGGDEWGNKKTFPKANQQRKLGKTASIHWKIYSFKLRYAGPTPPRFNKKQFSTLSSLTKHHHVRFSLKLDIAKRSFATASPEEPFLCE